MEELEIEKLKEKLNKEKEILEKEIILQKQKKTIIYENYNIVLMNSINTHDSIWKDLLDVSSEKIDFLNTNIEALEKLQQEIQANIDECINKDNIESEIAIKYQDCLQKKNDIMEKITNNNILVDEYFKNVLSNVKRIIFAQAKKEISNSTEQTENKEELEKHDEYIDERDNKTLIISENDKKVFLPYKYTELEVELAKKKQYKTVEELIENEYVLSLDKFRNSVKSRFKEAYNLIKKKEKGSMIKATQLGLELMFNYSLNPAIIAACKNEDELYSYLDCLEDNELDLFEVFDVEYRIAPK